MFCIDNKMHLGNCQQQKNDYNCAHQVLGQRLTYEGWIVNNFHEIYNNTLFKYIIHI